MARKEITFVVQDQASRDVGKEFIITEMSAWDGEELASQLFRIMGEQGITGIPDDVINMGSAGLGTIGMNVISAASPEAARALRDRLLSTVQIAIESEEAGRIVRAVNGKIDFEEIETIRLVMAEVFKVNFGFLTIGEQ